MNFVFQAAFLIAMMSLLGIQWVQVFYEVNQSTMEDIEFRAAALALFSLSAMLIRVVFVHGNEVNRKREEIKAIKATKESST